MPRMSQKRQPFKKSCILNSDATPKAIEKNKRLSPQNQSF